eukprot:5328977-Amphidinium_carterae.1
MATRLMRSKRVVAQRHPLARQSTHTHTEHGTQHVTTTQSEAAIGTHLADMPTSVHLQGTPSKTRTTAGRQRRQRQADQLAARLLTDRDFSTAALEQLLPCIPMTQHRKGIASTQFGKQVTRGRTHCVANHTMPHVHRYLQEHTSHTLALDCRSGHWTWSINVGTSSEPHVDKLNMCSYLLALPADSPVYLTQGQRDQQLGATYRRFDATQEHHVHCNEKRITLSCFYLRQDHQQQIYTRSVQVYYQDKFAHTRITGPQQPTIQNLAEAALRQLGLPDHLEDHDYNCRVAGHPVHNTFILPEKCQLQLQLQPKAPGTRYLPLAPSFRGGGDSGKGQGLGKILQAVKAHLLNDKFKDIIATGDQQKLKQHLDKESKRLGMQPKGQVIEDKPTTTPSPTQDQRKGAKGKGGKQQSKAKQPKEVKTVALPAGDFKVAGNALPVRSQLVMCAPGVALAQDTMAVLQDYKRFCLGNTGKTTPKISTCTL